MTGTHVYAKALKEVLERASEKERKKVVARLKIVLKRRQHVRHFSSVLKEFEQLWVERKGKQARAVVARPLGRELKAKVSRELLEKGFQYNEEVQEDVLGGIALFLGKDYLIDNTVRSKLAKLHG
ncbi:MAG: F0F1 ATP synthase subunit delta [Candidatus Wildermuthbacteria bacterium]|nr:F0F1 ATP synthase subunit delta [Candidatus Wildermuthbacteria bacterium]